MFQARIIETAAARRDEDRTRLRMGILLLGGILLFQAACSIVEAPASFLPHWNPLATQNPH
ncbi:hypothetical protein [Sphingomonas oryzagri]